MTTRTKLTVDTEEYVLSHGRSPRGIGLWMFMAHRNGAWTTIQAHGKYADALKAAKAEARTIGGCDTLIVMP